MKKVVIFGATSAIAISVSRLHASQGDELHLCGRNAHRLKELSSDLRSRGAPIATNYVFDLADSGSVDPLVDELHSTGEADIYYFFHGVLPDQKQIENDWRQVEATLQTNLVSHVSLITRIVCDIEMSRLRDRSIVVISSVAGDRGRKSNYLYGAAKSGLSTFSEGLSARLADTHNHCVLVKPGFVDTPMTSEFDKGLLWATPEKVAQQIYNAVAKKKTEIYTPNFWRWLMLIIKSIPGFIFRRLPL